MINTFEEDSYEEESVILECKVKAAMKILGIYKLVIRDRFDSDRIISGHRD